MWKRSGIPTPEALPLWRRHGEIPLQPPDLWEDRQYTWRKHPLIYCNRARRKCGGSGGGGGWGFFSFWAAPPVPGWGSFSKSLLDDPMGPMAIIRSVPSKLGYTCRYIFLFICIYIYMCTYFLHTHIRPHTFEAAVCWNFLRQGPHALVGFCSESFL